VRLFDARQGLHGMRPRFVLWEGSAMTTAAWFHCAIEPMGRSQGRSAVAAAAYRFGISLHDERYAITHDYSRKRGVECSFIVAPTDAPQWAHDPKDLWNEAERAEKRSNSRVAREAELALPAFLSAAERRSIVKEFSEKLVERYGVVASAAMHAPSRSGDQRNYHAHIMFTTRELTPEGLGKKTRILDDRKTGPQEITKLRELAADIINRHLAAANSDVRVDHRSYKERGIAKEPTTHLGPAATEMERRGETSERGDINREAAQANRQAKQNEALVAERNMLDQAIAAERERISSPPTDPEDARERQREAAQPFREAIETNGAVPDIQSDGLNWWQRLGMRLAEKARAFAIGLADWARSYWPSREQEQTRRREPENDRGIDR
jgi:hypothetical protein